MTTRLPQAVRKLSLKATFNSVRITFEMSSERILPNHPLKQVHLNEETGERDELSFKCTVHFRPPTKVSLFTKVWVAKRHTMTINLCGKSANSFQDVLGLFSMYGRFLSRSTKSKIRLFFDLERK